MNKKIKVLIFPAGSEIAIEIWHSLKYNLHLELFGASGKPDHAKLIYDQDHYFEDDFYVTKPDFIERLNHLLLKLDIDFVIPTHDTIALFLAQHKIKIQAKVLTSNYETAAIAREKRMTYELFKDFDFCPKLYEDPYDEVDFPLFLKPNIGEGGKRTLLAENKESLFFNLKKDPDLLACEYLPGEELSVDCFTNKDRKLLFIGPRTRERIQMGISFHSSSVPVTDEIQEIAKKINELVLIRGAWFFQIKKDKNGRYKLLEFAVRQASTMGLYRQIGVNFALLSIFDSMDVDVKIVQNMYHLELDRCLYNRYKLDLRYDCVYIDFDDTIIVEGKVNDIAIKYLYFCKQSKTKVVLLTKHKFDIYQSLDKYCIHRNLFDEIVLIDENDEKSKYIKHNNSIFIDNYFFDREKVVRELNIPVFDVDAIESLIQ